MICKIIILIVFLFYCEGRKQLSFPEHFRFGVGTSAYQTEGAWNISGKGESIWDRATHTTSHIKDRSTGDIACNSYFMYKEDIQNLKQLKVDYYRFSLSWTRIFPTGRTNHMNQAGIDYYNNLIDGLLAVDITPMVTLFHWDTPQALQDLNGWTNNAMIEWYVQYADKVFQLFGARVHLWTTFNEPAHYCLWGYTMQNAPYLNDSGVGTYLCAHNIIKAHAEVYHLYHRRYKVEQHGLIGITLDANWNEPADPDSKKDQRAAWYAIEYYFGWFAWPIFRSGDYPKSLKRQVAKRSKAQGFKFSRLPKFTSHESSRIAGSSDYLGLNHYISFLTTPDNQSASATPTWQNDFNVRESIDPSWKSTARPLFSVYPDGFRKLLLWVSEYVGPEVKILITENGAADKKTRNDTDRVEYLNSYLHATLEALNAGANIWAYTWWSFMDSFEWDEGYTQNYGLYYVDFENPKRPRTPKKSAMVYQNVIVTRKVDPTFNPKKFAH